jgi:hypothetical protein
MHVGDEQHAPARPEKRTRRVQFDTLACGRGYEHAVGAAALDGRQREK